MLTPLVSLVILASSALSAPTPGEVPSTTEQPHFNVGNPGATPLHTAPPRPNYMPIRARDLDATAIARRMLQGVDLNKRDFFGSLASEAQAAAGTTTDTSTTDDATTDAELSVKNCIGSWANDTYISSLFYYGGVGHTVSLCASAVIPITNAIFFSAANQTLQTVGLPTDDTRATIVVTGADQSTAIIGAVDGGNNIALRNVQVNGARDVLGRLATGGALLEMGGSTSGQIVDFVHAYEPRGWSCLHAIEGNANSCTGMVISNNDIGPSGHAPSGVLQFKRDNTGTYAAGEWADGISVACQASTVTGNIVTDATDGAIVIFGAPGTLVTGNTIMSVNRQLLGGINMVDYAPWAGDYTGTVVTGNTIVAESNFIKVGLGLGGMVWGSDNRTASRNHGGFAHNNEFISGSTGYFGYAIAVAGHEKATVLYNDATRANFGSIPSVACFTDLYPLPEPQSFIVDEWTTPNGDFQSNFLGSTIVIPICRGPSSVTTVGGLGSVGA